MKTLLLPAMLLFGIVPAVWAKDTRIKSWKTLRNDNGFEFKYPDCWTVRPDNPDEMEQPVTEAKDIAVEESKACSRSLSNPPHQNGVGLSAGWERPTRAQIQKSIEVMSRNAKGNIARKEWLYFKTFKIDSNNVTIFVDLHKDVKFTSISWHTQIFCPNTTVFFGGPTIKDPDPSYFEKFKAGDMAMPEPEKTIFDSIRCIEPKSRRPSD